MVNPKQSYKMMIITAIVSHKTCHRGVSRQAISAYLQGNYSVSCGSRFNTALRSALKSGIDAGIFVFGDSKQRFNLTEKGRKLKKKHKNDGKKRKKKKHKKQKSHKNPVKFKFNFNIALDRERREVINNSPDNDSKSREIQQSDLRDDESDNKMHGTTNGDARDAHRDVNESDNSQENNQQLQEIEDMYSQIINNMRDNRGGLTGLEGTTAASQCEIKEHEAIRQHILSVEKPTDLGSLLDLVSLVDLQSLIFAKLKQMDNDTLRTVFNNLLPIHKVLPEDVIQHILSFDDVHQNRTICKHWNRLNQQNEENMLREMYNAVDDGNLEPLGSGGQTWVIHPTRRTLHPMEIRRGYHGPLQCPSQAPEGMAVRFLLYPPGRYRVTAREELVQYIGLCPDDLQYCQIDDIRDLSVNWGLKQQFQNVAFNPDRLGLEIRNLSEFGFENCTIQFGKYGSTLDVGDSCILNMAKCAYFGGRAGGGIQVSSGAKRVSITNSSFSESRSCVVIHDRNQSGSPERTLVNLNITNNVFRDTWGEHLVLRTKLGNNWEGIKDRSVIHGNTSNNKHYDPNKLYIKEYFYPASRTVAPLLVTDTSLSGLIARGLARQSSRFR